MDLINQQNVSKILSNIQTIKNIMKTCKTISYLTSSVTRNDLQTIDIHIDRKIVWNEIKHYKNLQFKIIDDQQLMEKYFAKRNVHHINQAHKYYFTLELSSF